MNSIRVVLFALALSGLSVSAQAKAAAGGGSNKLLFTSNAGFVCKPLNGVYTNFNIGAVLMKNISTSDQTLTCNLPLIRNSVVGFTLGATGYTVRSLFNNASAGQVTITCVAATQYAGQSATTISTSTKQLVLAAGASGQINWTPTDLVIKDALSPVNLTCPIPAGVSFGRVDVVMP
jgi:hypothetical protein